ncbi:MAG: hypothetical protein KBA96_07330 [Rhodocyclaceae bacterium]|nr:hypothetical protein [Rhodocyclaceae bacterium]MBP7080907.1 hypothetical protein [Rhodocyclaceae bacterium]
MIPSVSLNLLTQDNSIPGNRKDGFRYHHLLFVIVLTPIYLWFELAFGVRLLDTMSGIVVLNDSNAIEHWGRLISGAAVALLLLSSWVRQCEKECIRWPLAVAVGLGITLFSFVVAWWAQGMVLDFYVQRSRDEIPVALSLLAATLIIGFILLRLWLKYATENSRSRYVWLSVGVIVILGVGIGQSMLLKGKRETDISVLGAERQATATLTVIRRALVAEAYTLDDPEKDNRALFSPEGKAYLALFPVFGRVLNQDRFASDRARLVTEFMYTDWQRDYGGTSFEGYSALDAELKAIYDGEYAKSKSGYQLDGKPIPAGLSFAAFQKHPAVVKHLRAGMGCFDCDLVMGMDRESFGREIFKWTQGHNVKQAVETLADPKNFESGRYGERAARIYWAPILALLFSMAGAFIHVFKLLVTITAYFHRVTFDRIDSADSPLANEVIANNTRVTAAAIVGLALFVYFADNRITGNAGYIAMREKMWGESPIIGAIAAHWTVNAQGFVYPFTKKIRPPWLTFNNDPIADIPYLNEWLAVDYE